MKEQKPKYPPSLFWSGVALSILRSFLWLILSTVLLLLGRRTPWCGIAGLALLVLVVAIAIVRQAIYRHTVLHSDTPEFSDWQAAMLSSEWEENVKDMVERALYDDVEEEPEEESEGTERDAPPTDGESPDNAEK